MFCGIESYNTMFKCCFSALTSANNRSAICFLALPIIRCSKSAQKSAVQVC